jgi:threonine dehydratase
MNLNIEKEVMDAEKRVRPYVLETPLEYSRFLSKTGGCDAFLKLENVQRSGSFKFRGAANFMLSLGPGEVNRGVLTASTGNHGAAFAEMLEIMGCGGTIYLPENAAKAKVDFLRLYNADLKFHGGDCLETELFARQTAGASGRVFVPPYNHPKIVGGQGTAAVELTRQLKTIDSVLVPVGGGGLAAGIAGYLKAVNRSVEIIGCQPEHSPVMFESVKAGRIVDMESKPTLSDGTAGGMEPGSITFPLCRDLVDDYILVSEKEIAAALCLMLDRHFMLIEGAAALSVACFMKEPLRFKNKHVVLIISGKKITRDKLKTIICPKEES